MCKDFVTEACGTAVATIPVTNSLFKIIGESKKRLRDVFHYISDARVQTVSNRPNFIKSGNRIVGYLNYLMSLDFKLESEMLLLKCGCGVI